MDGLYKIGAVSRLTGINIPTLRSWENKYSIVTPTRINGTQRGYTKDDLDKLSLIQALLEAGDSISSLQGLSIEELERRLEDNTPIQNDRAINLKNNFKAISIGTMIPNLDKTPAGLPKIDLIHNYDLSQYSENDNVEFDPSADLLIVELPTLHTHTVEWISRLQNQNRIEHSIVLYRYASPGGVKASSNNHKINILRQPVSAQDIQLMCGFITAGDEYQTYTNQPSASDHQPFTEKELWEISIMANPVHCECPKHLSSIISSLLGFEKYSADCEELSESDRLLHNELEANAKQARIIMENSLRKVIEENAVDISSLNAS